jgi:hypothetical protein
LDAKNMLELSLRDEFRSAHLRGTVVSLTDNNSTGATQVAAQDFLEITYPTLDVLKALEAIGPGRGRPVVVMGERGQGKSHILAVMHHALRDPTAVEGWLEKWKGDVEQTALGAIKLRSSKMHVITESLQNQRIKNLWDLFTDGHPEAKFFEGAWGRRTDVPSRDALFATLQRCPTALILDEFQTWFDGLTNQPKPRQTWNFNFIQVLSEIASQHPDLLVLVVSVRNGQTEAYQQIHRVNPIQIDFKAGGSPDRIQADRRKMLLHRLFRNRRNIDPSAIETLISSHFSEFVRLMSVPESDWARQRKLFLDSWPFSPDLLSLLEDQILVATQAQETRDLIRILANLFKSRGENAAILTASDVRIDDDKTGVVALLDSVSVQRHRSLREIALRNMESVRNAIGPTEVSKTIPHYRAIISSIWLRSISAGNQPGAVESSIHADITKSSPVDDNLFAAEIALIVENSFNLHEAGGRLLFKEEENPDAKLKSGARNGKNFAGDEDKTRLAEIIRHVLTGTDTGATHRVIVLPENWQEDPWSVLDQDDKPAGWGDKIPILVIPETPRDPSQALGTWLKDHVEANRNVPRYLLPKKESGNIFSEPDLLFYARVDVLGVRWDGEYKRLAERYREKELKPRIKKLFNKFLVLSKWDFQKPSEAEFITEGLALNGEPAAKVIAEKVKTDLFEPETLHAFVLEAAAASKTLKSALSDLMNPRPAGAQSVIWLGKTEMIDRIVRVCAKGEIALNVLGNLLQADPGENEPDALRRIQGRITAPAYQNPESVVLSLPQATPTAQTTPSRQVSAPSENGAADLGGLFKPWTSNPTSPLGSAAEAPVDIGSNSPPLDIFGTPGASTQPTRSLASAKPTSGLNLIGQLEAWQIRPATRVRNVTVTIAEATGAQIDALLKKLPDGMVFGLQLEAKDD